MKKSARALAVVAALFLDPAAMAQSEVQIYGIIDAGVEYVNHAAPGDGSVVRVVSGGKNTSRWGFRGSEDLGAGLKAVFNLEGAIGMDTGDTGGGPLFKRQANVGLEGGFGRIVVGRSFTTTYDLVSKFDPMGYAPNYSWATTGSATGPSKYGMTTGFDNLVKYTGHSGGLTYGATVGLGEQAGHAADGRKVAVGGSWSGGGLGVMATWEQVNGNTLAASGRRDQTRAWHLGAAYQSGRWRTMMAMRGFELDSATPGKADLRADTCWAGVSYLVGNVTLTGAAYHINTRNLPASRDADPTMVVVRAMVAFSKRTTFYVVAAQARAAHGQPIGLSRDELGSASTQTGLTTGIQYRF
ncbi:porin [Herbaspirillum sp. SJZ107]|uniref:porin n=1 Tax=Herbaspirillum sp. SJZ107 TaxID=2572881 RepID=UPI001154F19A|nr:porin [Herbaspirillum sp. SJZ107]TQK11329.1 putative porin [Herbaspirillum sp. SJZ107]